MWKSFLAGTTAVALIGPVLAIAQQSSDQLRSSAPSQQEQRAAPGVSDAQALLEARIAALRAGLALSPDQDKLWPPFERAYRDFVRARGERPQSAPADAQTVNPIERWQRWADMASRRAGALKQLADAAAPLFQSLDEGQKRRFWMLVRPLYPRLAAMGEYGMVPPGAERWSDGERGFAPWHHPFHGWRDRDDLGGPGRWGWREGDDDRRGDDRRGPGYGYGYGPHMGPGWGSPGWGGRDRDDDGPGWGPRSERRGPPMMGRRWSGDERIAPDGPDWRQRERDGDRRRDPPPTRGTEPEERL